MNHLLNSTQSFILMRALAVKTGYLFLFTAHVCCFSVVQVCYHFWLLCMYGGRFKDNADLNNNSSAVFHFHELMLNLHESIFYNLEQFFKEQGDIMEDHGWLCNNHGKLFYYHGRLFNDRGKLFKDHGVLHNDHGNLYNDHGVLINDHGNLLNDHGLLFIDRALLFFHHGGLIIDRGCLLYYHGNPFNYHGRQFHYHGKRERNHGNLTHHHGKLLQSHGTMFTLFDRLFRKLKKLLLEIEHRIKRFSCMVRDHYKRFFLFKRRPIDRISKMENMKVQIALKQKKQSNLTAMYKAEHYISNITGNPLFQAPDVVEQLARVVTANTNLHTEITAAISDNKTNKINAAREALDREVTDLKNRVEGIANKPETHDSERLVVVHSAGMSDKAQISHTARIFKALNGVVSGTIILLARGGARANEWQYTTDTQNFTGRIALKTTTKAMLEVPNLPINTPVAFFHKATIANVDTDWEGPVIITVL